MSLLTSLPLELVLEIFQLAIPDDPDSLNVCAPHNAPMSLAGVCSSWRTIVLSAPLLWRRFYVECETIGFSEHLADLASMWLSRSGIIPLDIGITGYLFRSGDRFQSIIKDHSHRIRSLHLWIGVVDAVALGARGLLFPALEELNLQLTDYEEGDLELDRNPLAIFSASHRLWRLELDQIPLSSLTLPFAQITRFDAWSYGFIETMQALRQLPHLTHFKLSSSLGHEGAVDDTIDSLVQSNLRTLYLVCSFPEPLLDRLTLPSLEILDISCEHVGPMLEALLGRSSARLQKLTLFLGPVGVQKLPSFSNPCFEFLEELQFQLARKDDFEAFCRALGSDRAFLPNLRSLDIKIAESDLLVPASGFESPLQQLGRAILQRSEDAALSVLRFLRVTWRQLGYETHAHLSELEALFQALKEAGVNLDIGP